MAGAQVVGMSSVFFAGTLLRRLRSWDWPVDSGIFRSCSFSPSYAVKHLFEHFSDAGVQFVEWDSGVARHYLSVDAIASIRRGRQNMGHKGVGVGG